MAFFWVLFFLFHDFLFFLLVSRNYVLNHPDWHEISVPPVSHELKATFPISNGLSISNHGQFSYWISKKNGSKNQKVCMALFKPCPFIKLCAKFLKMRIHVDYCFCKKYMHLKTQNSGWKLTRSHDLIQSSFFLRYFAFYIREMCCSDKVAMHFYPHLLNNFAHDVALYFSITAFRYEDPRKLHWIWQDNLLILITRPPIPTFLRNRSKIFFRNLFFGTVRYTDPAK